MVIPRSRDDRMPNQSGPHHGSTRGCPSATSRVLEPDSLVYIADDQPANRALLSALLARDPAIRTEAFADGRQLLDAIRRREPDLVLLDLRMPVMDGYDTLVELARDRDEEQLLPVIVLTADHDPAARRRMLRAGAKDFLTKPFDGDEVMLRVRNHLETRHLNAALRRRAGALAGMVEMARDDLASTQREWLEAAAALGQLRALDTAEETAALVCSALGRVAGLSSLIIVVIDAAGRAVPLACQDVPDVRFEVNRPLPDAITGHWASRMGHELWIGPWEPAFGILMSRRPHVMPTAMAILPIRVGERVIGGMGVTTAMPGGVAYLTKRQALLETFAAIASALLATQVGERQQRSVVRADVESVLTGRSFVPVYQPIIDLRTDTVVGYEALTRFDDGMRPDRRFADAAAVGMGTELELTTLQAAIEGARSLPDSQWLSLNLSPDLLMETDRLRPLIDEASRPLVLEVTEHVAIEDYARFRAAVASLGGGVRIAVDDAGAGYASFRHILELRPDFVKLDRGLVEGIQRDPVRQALVTGIVYFASRSGCQLVAEGIERLAEREAIQKLGVVLGQGILLGPPANALQTIHRALTKRVIVPRTAKEATA